MRGRDRRDGDIDTGMLLHDVRRLMMRGRMPCGSVHEQLIDAHWLWAALVPLLVCVGGGGNTTTPGPLHTVLVVVVGDGGGGLPLTRCCVSTVTTDTHTPLCPACPCSLCCDAHARTHTHTCVFVCFYVCVYTCCRNCEHTQLCGVSLCAHSTAHTAARIIMVCTPKQTASSALCVLRPGLQLAAYCTPGFSYGACCTTTHHPDCDAYVCVTMLGITYIYCSCVLCGLTGAAELSTHAGPKTKPQLWCPQRQPAWMETTPHHAVLTSGSAGVPPVAGSDRCNAHGRSASSKGLLPAGLGAAALPVVVDCLHSSGGRSAWMDAWMHVQLLCCRLLCMCVYVCAGVVEAVLYYARCASARQPARRTRTLTCALD